MTHVNLAMTQKLVYLPFVMKKLTSLRVDVPDVENLLYVAPFWIEGLHKGLAVEALSQRRQRRIGAVNTNLALGYKPLVPSLGP